ncbi:MAG TPA: MFS transporter [Angustibacter sp.]|nr:MFS transporter [Angustibacter sp.]
MPDEARLTGDPAVSASFEDVARRAQRRTLGTLVSTQALGGVGVSAAVSVNALLAKDVSGSESLAGLAQTSAVVGAAVVAAILARVMSRHGRRPGLTLGYLLGTAGAVLDIVAGTIRFFPLLLVGSALLGSATAANNQSRYAATDLSHPDHRGRHLSLVVWATTIGSVFGPNLAGPGGAVAGWIGVPAMTGPFIFSAVGMLLAAAVMTLRLRPDPLLLARSHREPVELHPAVDDVPDVTGLAPASEAAAVRAWPVIRSSPRILAATAGMALSQATMVSVMVMTPIHMDHGHASLEIIGLVISVHILGMYAFSPLVGWLVDRLGSVPVLAAGGITLLASLALAGSSHPGASWTLGVGLFLLGLGWSLGAVAASTLLTAATPAEYRPQVQGTTDMIVGFTAAAGGAVAGLVVGWLGFGWLNAFAAVLAFGVVAAAQAARVAHRS